MTGALILQGILIALYFIPTLMALATKSRALAPILVVNLFLGWTLIGWVVCLAWAFAPGPAAPPVVYREPLTPQPQPQSRYPELDG
jgi:hypothetical protein